MSDTNRHGRSVPNGMCVLCAESTADIDSDEHARHVDFIAARGRAAGYHTAAPSPDEFDRSFREACNQGSKVPLYPDPVAAILAVECPFCSAASGLACGLEWTDGKSEHTYCAARIRAAGPTKGKR